ncbi:hypothetical protein B7R22_11610 [Subtercola boreus]|uniref:Uncharacterized protein n=1 Tax=Subtercola boreus TaxID=120213 RepID=A0A3E0VUS4_9MICO|nr:hypothetical protein [Subtercola boreus]RFA13824.1 hypothetical protein B7R22_11610 [Subtercola boreus]
MSRRKRIITAGILAAVCASSIVGGGALGASADPVAPTVKGSQTYFPFVVPEPGSSNRTVAPVHGYIGFGSWPGVTTGDFALSVGCDDAQTYALSSRLYPSWQPVKTEIYFDVDLPLSLVGHSCTLTATASNGQTVQFAPPRYDNDKGKTSTLAYGSLVYRSRTGGL